MLQIFFFRKYYCIEILFKNSVAFEKVFESNSVKFYAGNKNWILHIKIEKFPSQLQT